MASTNLQIANQSLAASVFARIAAEAEAEEESRHDEAQAVIVANTILLKQAAQALAAEYAKVGEAQYEISGLRLENQRLRAMQDRANKLQIENERLNALFAKNHAALAHDTALSSSAQSAQSARSERDAAREEAVELSLALADARDEIIHLSKTLTAVCANVGCVLGHAQRAHDSAYRTLYGSDYVAIVAPAVSPDPPPIPVAAFDTDTEPNEETQ